MLHGVVGDVIVNDAGSTPFERNTVRVNVDFYIDRSVLFEFMDALRPIDALARREPILAILEHSALMGAKVDE